MGDCYRFCVALARRLAAPDLKVRFVLGTVTHSLAAEGGGVTHLATSVGNIEADAFVMAAGPESVALCRSVGLTLPVYPLKGYSLTLPVQGAAPAVSVTDFKRKVVYAPLDSPTGPQLRVAGMADIAGWSREPDPVRVQQLLTEARRAFPRATDFAAPLATLQPWCGLRPATPQGTPVLGATPIRNLFLNVGQGALGWTLALACGAVIADVIGKRTTAVPLDGFRLG